MRRTGLLCKWQRKVQAVRLLYRHHHAPIQAPFYNSAQLRCATTSTPVLLAGHKARRTKAKALQDTLGLRVRRILSTNETSSSQQQYTHVTRPTTPSPFVPCNSQSQQANDTQSTRQMYGLSPQELEQGIRRSLLRIVLSTDEALQPDIVLHHMRTSLEPTVQDKCAWVNYCIARYIQHKLEEQHNVENSETREANEEDVVRMCSVGKAYCMLYRRGIIQLITMKNKKTEAKAARRQRHCAVTDVLAWMTYTILLCDPHFRISYYGQSVCYPCLPSLLLATYNVPHDGELYTRYAQLVQSSLLPTTDSTSSENGQWTVLHSMFYLFDGFVENSLSHLVVDPLRVRQLMSQSSQTTSNTTTTSSLSALQQHWLRCWGNTKNVGVFSDNTTTATRKDDNNEEPFLTGLNEAKVGGVSLRKLVEELTSGAATSLTQTLARRRAAGNTLYLIQARMIRPLFSYVVCSPIALTRLAMLLRWHVSLPIASAFPSLLHFLLVFAGNPTVRRMYERDRERRQSRVRLGNFFAGLAHPNLTRRQRQVALKATPVYRSQLHSSNTPTATSNVMESNNNSEVVEEGETRRLRAVFAAHTTTTTTTSASSAEITRLIFFRILPSHRRPSTHTEGATTTSTTTTTYTSIEVLDTDHCTPKEILAYLQRTVAKEKSHITDIVGTSDWLRAEEEYILCYPVSRVVLTQRLYIVARAWVTQQECKEEGGGESEGTTLTVGQLCRLCLWEHEYGPVMASEMMWAYLSVFPDLVQLGPASGPFALRRVTFLRGV